MPGSQRSVFKEKRLCLALLYSLLSQYRLREAQELGDHMARLIQHRAGHQKNDITCESVYDLYDDIVNGQSARAVKLERIITLNDTI